MNNPSAPVTLLQCGHCHADVPLMAYNQRHDDHLVIVTGPITVEPGDVDVERNVVAFVASQDAWYVWCSTLPPRPHQAPQDLWLRDCPECRAGKHPNCNGETWDESTDRPAACPCDQRGHQ